MKTYHFEPKIDVAVRSRDQLGETPLWCDRQQALLWIDIEKPKLHSFHPATGAHSTSEVECDWLGSQALCEDGRRLIAKDLSLYLYDDLTDKWTLFVSLEAGLDNRLNDGRVDAQGRLWIGTMDNQLYRPNGALYRVLGDGSVMKFAEDVIVSNGIAISPDGKRLHFTDTRRYISWVYDLDPIDGVVTKKRVFADYSQSGERPDGACFDADGCLWTAFFAGGKVVRYTPSGAIDKVIQLPLTNPTCVCFGGPDYKTLYVTTASKFLNEDQLSREPLAGAVLAIEGVGQGLPENRFVVNA
ncbi:SMP-30/gluconolactonase/LRE family protein [Ochrobactrum sp. S46]|nr:SMP-30/gluconolactonase/LRE family protein [Ochrobactrum sp. S45]MBK0046129.1 SMP-30/gluconolactonase/LRE family protein [Ochrobactrum sp. S46]